MNREKTKFNIEIPTRHLAKYGHFTRFSLGRFTASAAGWRVGDLKYGQNDI
jgi:hypothetical protein